MLSNQIHRFYKTAVYFLPYITKYKKITVREQNSVQAYFLLKFPSWQ